MGNNTRLALERLCGLAENTSTSENEMAVINIIEDTISRADLNAPCQRTGEEVV